MNLSAPILSYFSGTNPCLLCVNVGANSLCCLAVGWGNRILISHNPPYWVCENHFLWQNLSFIVSKMEFTPSFYLPQMGQSPCLGKHFVQCQMELSLTEPLLETVWSWIFTDLPSCGQVQSAGIIVIGWCDCNSLWLLWSKCPALVLWHSQWKLPIPLCLSELLLTDSLKLSQSKQLSVALWPWGTTCPKGDHPVSWTPDPSWGVWVLPVSHPC